MAGISKKALINSVEPMCQGFADFYLNASLCSGSDTMEELPPPSIQLMLLHIVFTLLHVRCCSGHQGPHYKLHQPSVCLRRTATGANKI